MKIFIGTIAIIWGLILTSEPALAGCTTHTILTSDGRTAICTTCCYGSAGCTTTCY